ncbi:MAG TPA: hypothetical protein VFN97_09205 [Actinospica sp.]|nr:hypothetical protein [Actinospica sp.]
MTTTPERSFGRYFSRLGRLENAWAAALEQSDPARSLDRLRAVCRRFDRQPAGAAHLWLSFQECVLDERFTALLTDDDFERLSAVGRQSATATRGSLTEVWSPLIEASLARQDAEGRQRAYRLLTGLYWSSLTTEEERRRSAVTLAGFEVVGDAQLAVYADVASLPLPMPEVMGLIDRVLQVGFGDADQRLGQAYTLAVKLGERVPRMDAVFALGLGELLLIRRPLAALAHFQAVHGHDATDAEALRGVVAAHLHARQFAAAVSAATAATALNPRGVELLDLCRQLAWLDAPQSLTEIEAPADAPPHTAQRLTEIAPGRDVGPWLDYAIGRSHLVEGEAEHARRYLAPLPAGGRSDPDALYHAAWAHLLCQDVEPIRTAFVSLTGRPGGWALACILQDAEPGQPIPAEFAPVIPAPLQAVARARDALAGQGAVAQPPDLAPLALSDTTTRPDLFEALRTALGVAVARNDDPALDGLTRQPLFARLPAAERLLWTALAVRPADPERARRDLHRSLSLGRKRAALILAVDALDDGRAAEARALLNGVTGPKAALTLAWADVRTGALAQAAERFETLSVHGSAHADYALGLLAFREAAGAWARERTERAKSRAEQAVNALTAASRLAPARFDTTTLNTAAGLLKATPAPDDALPWQDFAARPWTARQLAFSQLVIAPESVDAPLLRTLAAWALRPTPSDEHPPEYAALAAAVLRVALLTTDTAISRQAATLLADLAERVPAPEIRIAARRATACAALTAGNETTEASKDPLIALAAMPMVVAERALAVRILYAAFTNQSPDRSPDPRPEYRTLAILLAAALDRAELPERLPLSLPPRAESALALAAALGADKDEEAAAQMLLRALRTSEVSDLVDIDRALAALSTQVAKQHGSTRAASASALAPIVLRAVEHIGEPDGLRNHPAARYATVVNEFETADKLWLRALDDARADATQLPELRTEYGRFLCHRAVLAHLGGQREQMFGYLRTAATYTPEPAERILRQLEADERIQKLVVSLFPDSPILTWQRPGRYPALNDLIAANPDLRSSLDAGRRDEIVAQWRRSVADNEDDGADIELRHTIAVLSREDALARPSQAAGATQSGVTATALWMLLLAEPELRTLFADRPHAAEADARLRTHLIDELLVNQKGLLTRSLANRDLHAVRAHVHCLVSVEQGTAATRTLVAADFTGIAAHTGVEAEFTPITERATALLEEWGAERIAAGQLRLVSQAPTRRRAKPVATDYGAAIEEVEVIAQLGLGLKDVLRVALEWHNAWLHSMRGTLERRVGDHIVRSAKRFVDLLAPMCTPGQADRPEVRTLAEHYIELGVYNFGFAPDESIRLLQHAREWNPNAQTIPDLLWEAYMRCLEVAKKHLDRGSLPDAEASMSLVPEGWRMLSTELNNRGVAKMSRVYDTVVSFNRRRTELSPAQRANFIPELLDAERLLLEAGRLDPTETGIGENLEQIRELMRILSPGLGGAYR